jgi:hypothetical protein
MRFDCLDFSGSQAIGSACLAIGSAFSERLPSQYFTAHVIG